jgi:ABC-type phosphate transport system substrate-binding protein
MFKHLALGMAALLVIATATLSGTAGGDDLVVIVNKANPAAKLTKSELRAFFLVLKTNWPNGTEALPINLPESNQMRRRFDQAVLGWNPDEVANYWIDRKIRGDARAPKKVSSTLAVLKVVSGSEGAVGYMHRSETTPQVKIVAAIQGGSVTSP